MDVKGEWNTEGVIEIYDQIDSLAYVVHPWLKYPKFGHARATDVSGYWIRNDCITREQGIQREVRLSSSLRSENLLD
jgi:hypothetical protein